LVWSRHATPRHQLALLYPYYYYFRYYFRYCFRYCYYYCYYYCYHYGRLSPRTARHHRMSIPDNPSIVAPLPSWASNATTAPTTAIRARYSAIRTWYSVDLRSSGPP